MDNKQQASRQKQVDEIMSSDKPLFSKMQSLTLETDYDDDISMIMLDGADLSNILFKGRLRLEDEVVMTDFIQDYACYFEALQQCLNECDKPQNKVVCERFPDDIQCMREAVSLWNDLKVLSNIPDSRSNLAQRQQYYNLATEFINRHASYQTDAHYVKKQQTILANFYLHDSSLDLTMEELEFYKKVLADNDVNNTNTVAKTGNGSVMSDKQKAMNKKNVKTAIICASVEAVLSVISIIVGFFQPYVGVVMLGIVGVTEIVTAIAMWVSVNRKIRFTCPSCGTKRIWHRTFIGTTTKDSNVQKTVRNGGSSYTTRGVKTEFTHHYEEHYVCPQCGETLTREIKITGGYYTVYNDGSIMDQRRAPLADC